ncbi:hypothetical protein MLD52_07800 [Puniceicoccaceae bacterium K14]|nr:hypothetical protein [Puniceicoccaceae bacterium K14]
MRIQSLASVCLIILGLLFTGCTEDAKEALGKLQPIKFPRSTSTRTEIGWEFQGMMSNWEAYDIEKVEMDYAVGDGLEPLWTSNFVLRNATTVDATYNLSSLNTWKFFGNSEMDAIMSKPIFAYRWIVTYRLRNGGEEELQVQSGIFQMADLDSRAIGSTSRDVLTIME